MRNTLNIIRNHLEPDIIETHVSDKNIIEMLMTAFDDKLPPHVRIYHKSVVFENDVTPFVDDLGNVSVEDIEYLISLEGEFWAVYRPDADPFTWAMVALAVLSLAATFLLKPKIPNVSIRNTTAESPNNSLSNRENAARPRARVPDIYGQVRSTPDLIAVPLRYYINHNEYELSYMCVGRGEYEIARIDSLGDSATEAQKRYDIRENTTPVHTISGTSVEVFEPYTRPSPLTTAEFAIDIAISAESFTMKMYTADINVPVPSAVRNGTGVLVIPQSALSPFSNLWTNGYVPSSYQKVISSSYTGTYWNISFEVPFPQYIAGSGGGSSPAVSFVFTLPSQPSLRIGAPIEESIYLINKIDSVDGQTLTPPNARTIAGDGDIKFVYPNCIEIAADSPLSFADLFASGSTITVSNATDIDDLEETSFVSPAVSVADFQLSGGDQYVYVQKTEPSQVLPSGITAGKDIVFINFTIFKIVGNSGIYQLDLSGTYNVVSVNDETDHWRIRLFKPYQVKSGFLEVITNEGNPFQPAPNVTVESWTGTVLNNYDGVYEVETVFDKLMYLKDPETVNANWSTLTETNFMSPIIESDDELAVGYFMVNMPELQFVQANFVAMQGLYRDDGRNQRLTNVQLAIEITPCSADGSPTGAPEVYYDTIIGSASSRDMRALTMRIKPNFSGRCLVRAWRVSPTDTSFQGTVVDEIKWKDLYGLAQVDKEHFGNKTTVLVQTKATTGALSLKGRKLNMLVTRKLPRWQGGTIFTEALYPTKNAADIISAISLDPHIGNCSVDEVDFAQLYDTMDEIEEYFGNIEATEFCYTFDKKLSYEETVQAVAEAIFCNAYRRGGVIRLFFDKKRDISSIVLNHRNKIPGTEKRNIKFGIKDNRDGVSYQWVNPENNDNLETLYIRNGVIGEIPINPEPIESIGVRNYRQAYWHLMRAWNRLKYQHTTVEVDAIGQAELTMVGDKITCADNTRASVQDGEIEGYEPLKLITSQPVAFETGVPYTVFIQLPNGTVQAIDAFPVAGDDYSIALASAPAILPVTDDTAVNKSTYVLSKSTDKDYNYFIVADRTQGENNVSNLKLINYDERYYSGDPDPYAGVAGYGYNYGNYYGGFYG
jgi:hypothetical protein